MRKYLERKDELGEMLAEFSRQELGEFKSKSKLLRRKPINSVEDLAIYDFFIMHPNFDDYEKVLPEILQKYPGKPIILPMNSVASGGHQTGARDFAIEDVKKDPRYPSVYIVDTDLNATRGILTLIEYLLDKREKAD